jgi:hypothetical protein
MIRLVFVSIVLVLAANCATPAEAMKNQVRDQAQRDLACDAASLAVVQMRPTQKVVDGRRGKVERTTYSAKGCGDYRAYVVECAKGNCRVDAIVEDPEAKNKRMHEGGGAP